MSRFEMRPGIGRKVAVAVVVLLLAVVPLVVTDQYYLHVVITAIVNSVLAMTFVLVLRTGLINLSMAAFWGLGAYGTALLQQKAGLSFWVALPLAVIVATVAGVLLGLIVVRFSGFGFVILTLVIASIIPVVFGTFEYFGRYVGILNVGVPEAIRLPGGIELEFYSKTSFYYLALVIASICVLVLLGFYASSIGRAWRAIGLSSALAQSVGIDLFRYRLVAWTLGCTIAAFVGGFYATYAGALVPGTFGPFKSIYVQIYAILGGMGFVILGPIVGAFLLTVLPELLRFSQDSEPILTGVIIILIVIFLPLGVLGSLAALWDDRRLQALIGRVWPRRRNGHPGVPLGDAGQDPGHSDLPQEGADS